MIWQKAHPIKQLIHSSSIVTSGHHLLLTIAHLGSKTIVEDVATSSTMTKFPRVLIMKNKSIVIGGGLFVNTISTSVGVLYMRRYYNGTAFG